MECDKNSSKRASVKKALQQNLELKQELKVQQAASQESSLKKITEGDEQLWEWSQVITSISRVRFVAPLWISCGTRTRNPWTKVGPFHLPLQAPNVRLQYWSFSGCSPYNFSGHPVATGYPNLQTPCNHKQSIQITSVKTSSERSNGASKGAFIWKNMYFAQLCGSIEWAGLYSWTCEANQWAHSFSSI